VQRATKTIELPPLTTDLLTAGGVLVDSLFATLWREVGMKTLLSRAGFTKRSGTPIDAVLYHLILWVWLKQESIGMFARECLQAAMGKDALYEAMNREDLNWRRLHAQVAAKALRSVPVSGRRAFIVDDTVEQRFGKKMPGVSSHFDHTTGRHVMGQQVVSLGLSTEDHYVPLDDDLYVSQVQAQPLPEAFRDGRSLVARRYQTSVQRTKPEMVAAMLKRALASGVAADYLVADAWFGTKTMIRVTQDTALVPVLRMKRGKMKYRLTTVVQGRPQHQALDARALYQATVRKQWERMPGGRYQTKVIDADLNLAEGTEKAQWVKVRRLFVRGHGDRDTDPGQHEWALFLTTERRLSATDMLQIYSMRWSIEVYYKEAKQHLGFLKEQSNHYAAYVASIHLTAIRFCLLVIAKQAQGSGSLAKARQALCGNSADIHYASKLWPVFRALISGALDSMRAVLGEALDQVLSVIDEHVHVWFTQVLQLDPQQLRLEASDVGT